MLEKHGDAYLGKLLNRVFTISYMLDEPFVPTSLKAKESKIDGDDALLFD